MRLQNLQNNFVCLFGKSDRGREWPWQSARALQNVFMLSNVSSSNISEWHETPFSSRWSCCFSKPGGSEVLYKAKPRTANMNIRKMEKACLLLKWSGKQVSLPMTQWEADVLLFFQLSPDVLISFIDTSLWCLTAFSMHQSWWKYLQKSGTDIEDHRSKDFCQHLSSQIMTPSSQNPPLPAPNSKQLER